MKKAFDLFHLCILHIKDNNASGKIVKNRVQIFSRINNSNLNFFSTFDDKRNRTNKNKENNGGKQHVAKNNEKDIFSKPTGFSISSPVVFLSSFDDWSCGNFGNPFLVAVYPKSPAATKRESVSKANSLNRFGV
jgi:hypothetical protein